MGRTVIKKTECAFCHKIFDLATEDFDWEKRQIWVKEITTLHFMIMLFLK